MHRRSLKERPEITRIFVVVTALGIVAMIASRGWWALAALAVLLVALVVESVPGAVPKAVEGLAEDPDAIPAQLILRVGDLVYARDVGAIRQVDGWLVWTGIGTDFSMPASRTTPERLRWVGADGVARSAQIRAYRGTSLDALRAASSRPPKGLTVLPPERGRSPGAGLLGLIGGAVGGGVSLAFGLVALMIGPKDWLMVLGPLMFGGFHLLTLPGRFLRWRKVRGLGARRGSLEIPTP